MTTTAEHGTNVDESVDEIAGASIGISWDPDSLFAPSDADGEQVERLWRSSRGDIQPSSGVLGVDVPQPVVAFVTRAWDEGALTVVWPVKQPRLRVRATAAGWPLPVAPVIRSRWWRLSRFAYLHRGRIGMLTARTPLVPMVVEVLDAGVAAALTVLAKGCGLADIAAALTGVTPDLAIDVASLADLVTVLAQAGVITPCDRDGVTDEDDPDTEIGAWDFADALFHVASRQGRHRDPMGAGFRFHDTGSPPTPPVRAEPLTGPAIPLARVDLVAVAAADPPFTAVLESRRSAREHADDTPLTLHRLGEFLFRAARNRGYQDTVLGMFTSRPYPSGGGSYELELYLTVNRCTGLPRGVYYYDPVHHALHLIAPPGPESEAMLDDAYVSAAGTCRPQVLITIASRFRRVSWKYSGIAYAAQLKNVGVVYQTFYLVATAMGLAGCALGLGNAERFARLTGNSYFTEGSIGEFMIGSTRAPAAQR